MKAHEICTKASQLVSGDRDRQHGSKLENFNNIADLWAAYLRHPITAVDVGNLLVLLKVARTKTGTYNPDDYVDAAGYAGCAGEIAEILQGAIGEETK